MSPHLQPLHQSIVIFESRDLPVAALYSYVLAMLTVRHSPTIVGALSNASLPAVTVHIVHPDFSCWRQ